MNDLRTRLTELSERGTPLGADELHDRVLLDLARRSGQQRLPGWAVALAAAAVALVVIGATSILFGGSDGSIAPSGPNDTSPPTTLASAVVTPAGSVFPDGPIGYGSGPDPDGLVFATTSGGVMWAWDEFGGQIWRHTGDGWAALPITPGPVEWVAYGGGTVWAAVDSGFSSALHRLEGDEWVRPGVMRGFDFAADPVSGVVWTSTGGQLHRWDDLGRPSDVGAPTLEEQGIEGGWSHVGDITVTTDGTVWAAGFYGYMPDVGSLASYHPDSGEWQIVAPWNGDPMPAIDMATTSGGGLWVALLDWDGDRAVDGLTSNHGWALAHRNGTTGEWTVYDTDLPAGAPRAIAADDEAVWIINTGDWGNYSEPIDGLYRFDGTTWTHYLKGAEPRDVIVAPNGTVWYSIAGLSPLNQE